MPPHLLLLRGGGEQDKRGRQPVNLRHAYVRRYMTGRVSPNLQQEHNKPTFSFSLLFFSCSCFFIFCCFCCSCCLYCVACVRRRRTQRGRDTGVSNSTLSSTDFGVRRGAQKKKKKKERERHARTEKERELVKKREETNLLLSLLLGLLLLVCRSLWLLLWLLPVPLVSRGRRGSGPRGDHPLEEDILRRCGERARWAGAGLGADSSVRFRKLGGQKSQNKPLSYRRRAVEIIACCVRQPRPGLRWCVVGIEAPWPLCVLSVRHLLSPTRLARFCNAPTSALPRPEPTVAIVPNGFPDHHGVVV